MSVLEITQIDKKKQKHILKVGENQKISLLDSIPSDIYFYPPFVATSKHALLSKFLSNAFFYSDYHKVLNDFDRLCQQESTDYPHFCSIILESQNEIQDSFLDLCTKCLKKHPHPKIYYERGMVLFNQGDNLVALDDIRKLITYAEKHKYHEFLTSNLYLQEGQLLNESLSYDDAIIALTKAIEKDPKNQEAYFERAISYFEIGDFSKALSDYLASGIHTKTADHVLVGKLKYINFGQGIIRGIWKGGQDSVTEFVPSLLSCYRGISRGVWAFVSNPIIVSHDFINSACACIEYIKNHTQKEKLSKLVPEIQACLSRWNHLDDELKGIHIGHVIGKYGIDIFLGAGSVKAMRLYRDLRRANVVMTLETAVVSPKLANEILEQTIREEALRNKILKSGNIKIHWDKQGKHVRGHKNYVPQENRSILTHGDPQKLVNKYAGTGRKVNHGTPGKPGYKELIDFEESIGYFVDMETGEAILTNWGTIDYAKDGVHIIPRRPR